MCVCACYEQKEVIGRLCFNCCCCYCCSKSMNAIEKGNWSALVIATIAQCSVDCSALLHWWDLCRFLLLCSAMKLNLLPLPLWPIWDCVFSFFLSCLLPIECAHFWVSYFTVFFLFFPLACLCFQTVRSGHFLLLLLPTREHSLLTVLCHIAKAWRQHHTDCQKQQF